MDRSQKWYALRPIGPQILIHRASNLKHPYGTDFGRCLVGGVPNFEPYPHDMDMMLWCHGKIVWACLTISSLRILKVVLSRNWRYMEIPMIYPKVAIFMEKYAHSNPGILMQETIQFLGPDFFSWSSGMVVCLASLTSWRRSEDVTNHANDMGMVSWEKYRKNMGICGIMKLLI